MNMQQVIIIMFLTNTKKAKTNQRQTVNKMGKWINFGENICLSSAAYLGRRGSLSWDSRTTSSPATSSSSSWRTQRTAERYNFFWFCPGSHPSWACLNCTDSVWWRCGSILSPSQMIEPLTLKESPATLGRSSFPPLVSMIQLFTTHSLCCHKFSYQTYGRMLITTVPPTGYILQVTPKGDLQMLSPSPHSTYKLICQIFTHPCISSRG